MKRFAMHIVVWGYLLLTTCAFLFAVTRWSALRSNDLIMWSYGMLAPFQTAQTENHDLLIEARDETGEWVTINNDDLLPMTRSKRTVFLELAYYRDASDGIRSEKYHTLAENILKRLQLDHSFDAVRLSVVFWPQSAVGAEALRAQILRTIPLVQVP